MTETSLSEEVSAVTILPPPTNLQGSSSSGGVNLSWTNNDDSTDGNIIVQRSSDGGITYNDIETISFDATSYTDDSTDGQTTYEYRVKRQTDHTSSLTDSVEINFEQVDTPELSNISASTTSNESVGIQESITEINPVSVSVQSIISVGEITVLDVSNIITDISSTAITTDVVILGTSSSFANIESNIIVGDLTDITASENKILSSFEFSVKDSINNINVALNNVEHISSTSIESSYESPIDGLWEKNEYDEFDWQKSPPETPYIKAERASITVSEPTIQIVISNIPSNINVDEISEGERFSFRELIWDNGKFDNREWQKSPPETTYVEPLDIRIETLDASEIIEQSQSLSSASISVLPSIDTPTFRSLIWDNGVFGIRSWQTSPPENTFVTPEDVTVSSLTVSPEVTTVSSLAPVSIDSISDVTPIFRGLVWDEGSFNSRGWQTSPPQTQSVENASIVAQSITAANILTDAIANDVGTRQDISVSTFTDTRSIPVGVDGDGIWDVSLYNEFRWQGITPEIENAIPSDISVSTITAKEQIDIDNLSSSITVSAILAKDKEKFVDLVWDNFSFDVSAWQTSPPETQYTGLEIAEAETLPATGTEIETTKSISVISIDSISGAQAQTFDRLVWDKQTWNRSSWQESPPEYPFLRPTDVTAQTKGASGSTVTTSQSLVSIDATAISVDETTTRDRLLWNARNWDVSSWQTSPPEYPPLAPTTVSATIIQSPDTSITTSDALSTIDVSVKTSQKGAVFDRLSWDIQTWDTSSWQDDEQPFILLTPATIIATTRDVQTAEVSIASAVSTSSISTIQSTETKDLQRGSWEINGWEEFDWASDITQRIDDGVLSDISSDDIETDEISQASVISITDTSVSVLQSTAFTSANVGVPDVSTPAVATPILGDSRGIINDVPVESDISAIDIQSTDDIEITSAISLVSPETSSVTTLAVGDEQTSAGDVPSLAQPFTTLDTLDADTSSVDAGARSIVVGDTQLSSEISSALASGTTDISAAIPDASISITPISSIAVGSVLIESSIDESISTDNSFIEEAIAAPRLANAATLSIDQGIDAIISATTAEISAIATAIDNATVEQIDVTTISSTNQIEITRAIDEGRSATTIASVVTVEDEQTAANDTPTISQSLGSPSLPDIISSATDTTVISTQSAIGIQQDATASSTDAASITATTSSTPIVNASARAEDAAIVTVDTSTQTSEERTLAQDGDILSEEDILTLSVDANTSATDADDITLVEESSAVPQEAISIALALIESVETSLVGSVVSSGGEQTSADPVTSKALVTVPTQQVATFASSLDDDVILDIQVPIFQSDEFSSARETPIVQTQSALPKTIAADAIVNDIPSIEQANATATIVDAEAVIVEEFIIPAEIDTPDTAAVTSTLDDDILVTSFTSTTDAIETTQAADESINTVIDSNSLVADADTRVQDTGTPSATVAIPRTINADAISVDVSAVALSNVTEIQGVGDIEIASAISRIDPETSVASTIASGDEQTIATDASLRDDTNAAVAQIDAETSAFDAAGSRGVAAAAVGGVDVALASDGAGVVASSAAIVGVVDEAVAVGGASLTSVSAISGGSTENSVAADTPGSEGVLSVSLAGTDTGEFASSFEISSPAVVGVPPIASVSERSLAADVSSVAGAVVSVDVVGARALAEEADVLSTPAITSIGSTDDTTAVDSGSLAAVSASVQQTTDDIEITSSVVLFSLESLDVTPVVSSDEETTALEGGALSVLRGDDIVSSEETSALETPTTQEADASMAEPFVTLEVNEFPAPAPTIAITTEPFITLEVNDPSIPASTTATATTANASIRLLPLNVTAVEADQREALGSLEVASAVSTILPTTAATVPIVVEDEGAISIEEDAVAGMNIVSIASTGGSEGVVRKDEQTGGTVSDIDAPTSGVSFADTSTSQAVTASETSSAITDDA